MYYVYHYGESDQEFDTKEEALEYVRENVSGGDSIYTYYFRFNKDGTK